MSLLNTLKNLIPDRHPLRIVWHRTKGAIAAFQVGFPQKKLRMIGVTGTDGKTTTTGMIAHILRASGKSVGASSTTFFRINDDIQWNETHKTSVAPAIFQSFLKKCVEARCEFAVVECSSHGLVQGRLGPIRPEVAVMTNTSLEHLDYHRTMEQYRLDKSILFRRLAKGGTKVLNASDGSAEMLLTITSAKTTLFSMTEKPEGNIHANARIWCTGITSTSNGVAATIHILTGERELSQGINLTIPGTYNIENAIAAIGACMAVGVGVHEACSALSTFSGIPGRMERIDEGQTFSVFVDFTVTPLAYERALAAARSMAPKGRLLVLTGSCGDRMKEKRPMIGEICSRLADVVVVTTDETLIEDPLSVIEDVWEGVQRGNADSEKITDRKKAIQTLLGAAKPGDVVLLCGMGACQTMQTREGLVPWDERVIARQLLRDLPKS